MGGEKEIVIRQNSDFAKVPPPRLNQKHSLFGGPDNIINIHIMRPLPSSAEIYAFRRMAVQNGIPLLLCTNIHIYRYVRETFG